MQRDYKLGAILRCDNGGLGMWSQKVYRNLQPDKVLCVLSGYPNFPERFPGAIKTDTHPTEGQMRDFLDGLDSVLVNETPYNWDFFRLARERKVWTGMLTNYEWLEDDDRPNVYILPTTWHYGDVPQPRALCPQPSDFDIFSYRERRTAKTFLHVVGHNAGYDRNGTGILAEAIPMVKSAVRFVIRTQTPAWRLFYDYPAFGANDRRVEIVEADPEDSNELYADGDVFVLPKRYAGQSSAADEAALCGMPLITTWMQPQNEIFTTSAIFIDPGKLSFLRIKKEVEYANPNPLELARRIDLLAGSGIDLAVMSRQAHQTIASRTWEPWIAALRPK